MAMHPHHRLSSKASNVDLYSSGPSVELGERGAGMHADSSNTDRVYAEINSSRANYVNNYAPKIAWLLRFAALLVLMSMLRVYPFAPKPKPTPVSGELINRRRIREALQGYPGEVATETIVCYICICLLNSILL